MLWLPNMFAVHYVSERFVVLCLQDVSYLRYIQGLANHNLHYDIQVWLAHALSLAWPTVAVKTV